MKKIIHDVLLSTQTEARVQINRLSKPFVVMTYNQTSGYGKYGRVWESGAGNFAATFALDLSVSHYDFGKIPMLVSIKLCELLSTEVGEGISFRIKWPNDILLNKKKICGILIEKIDNTFLIGIGINLRQSPEDGRFAYNTTNVLQETGVLIKPDTILNELSRYFDHFNKEVTECNADQLRQNYMTLLEGLGQQIKVVTRKETFSGLLQDINNDGALVLNVEGTHTLIYSADVFI
jgi:BirA family transcriptional regulator, biotin operon repressor / biotin---[acetyl-CoA-carboxylase] ligase